VELIWATEQLNINCDRAAKKYVTSTKKLSTSFGNPAMLAAQPQQMD